MGSNVVDLGNGMYRVYCKGAPDFLMNNRVKFVATNNGKQPWKGQSNIAVQPESLPEIMRERGAPAQGKPTHEDVFKATVKDYAK